MDYSDTMTHSLDMNDKRRKNFLVPGEEPYLCEHCGTAVVGGRYNNHCPSCLWSKHVDDKIPGDRISKCQGMMEPIAVIQKKGKWRILQKCQKCDHRFIVDSTLGDNLALIIQLSQNPIEKL